MNKAIVFILISAVLTLASGCGKNSAYVSDKSQDKAEAFDFISPIPIFSTPLPTPLPTPAPAKDTAVLKSKLEAYVNGLNGKWSVYVKQISSKGEAVLINPEPLRSASVLKLFIMSTVYDLIEKGTLKENDVYDNLAPMITQSSNSAANNLLVTIGGGDHRAGIAKINAFINDNGYTNGTVIANGFDNPAMWGGNGVNKVSVIDCGILLEQIYDGECISGDASLKMLELLKQQETDYKIPQPLPDNVTVANKTGEADNIQNDAAIVMSEKADYVLCVFSNEQSSDYYAISHIQEISKMVYDYFNN